MINKATGAKEDDPPTMQEQLENRVDDQDENIALLAPVLNLFTKDFECATNDQRELACRTLLTEALEYAPVQFKKEPEEPDKESSNPALQTIEENAG